ncbi:MAG: thioredoxin family protein [Burkholderiaceae bacterium]|jgi:thioredoxin 1|nr:thioredoxin family protein [Oxalobacteraceae bacterium]
MQSLFLVPEQFPQLARALDEGRWVVACLCAAWCDVCKQYRPGFEGLAAEYPEQQFVWIDIEDQADLVGDLDVENFPTILIQHRDIVVFYGTMLPEPRQVARLLEAQLSRDDDELRREASSSAERQQWQQECNLRSLLAQFSA